MKNRRSVIGVLVVAAVAVIVGAMMLNGCGIRRAKDVERSGFLEGYYDLLKPGEVREATLTYRNPDADWRSYKKIIVDPVQVWRTKSAREDKVPMEDLQRVANNFHLILSKKLSKDYTIVTDPTKAGPRTLRIQTALTSMKKGGGVMDHVTTVLPLGLGISAATDFITGRPPFVGDVSIETKVIDARTGQLLGAGADTRIGGKNLNKMVDSWDDVNKILNFWSKLMVFRLCKVRGEKDCPLPTE